jgi:ankyrin repeat protein
LKTKNFTFNLAILNPKIHHIMRFQYLLIVLTFLFVGEAMTQSVSFPTDKMWWQRATVAEVQKQISQGAKINGKISDVVWNDEERLVKIAEVLPKTSLKEIEEFFDTPLKHAAAGCPDLDVIKYLISKGARLSDHRFSKLTFNPLTMAILHNPNIEVAKYLIQKKISVNEIQFGNVTTLMLALSSKDINRVKLLLNNGADVSIIDAKGRSVIDRTTNEEYIELLLKYGAKTNQKFELKKEVWTATTPTTLKSFLKKGGVIEGLDKYNETHLHYAARYSKAPEVIDVLIENGFELEAQNTYELTPLLAAAASNPDTLMIEHLIKKGANLNAVDNYKSNALMLAAKYNPNIEVLSYLLRKGIDPNALNKNGLNALFYVLDNRARINKEKRIRLLVTAGADLMNQNKSGYYAANYAITKSDDPLIRAIRCNANAKTVGEIIDQLKPDLNREIEKSRETAMSAAIIKNDDPEVIKVLIEKGDDAYQNVYYANTALDVVLDVKIEKTKTFEKVKVLLESGVDPNRRYNERTSFPIIDAARWHDVKIVDLLLKHGAKVKVKFDLTGGTPLHTAASNNPDDKVLISLINHKAKTKAKDRYGKTPLECADKNKKLDKNSEGYKLLKSKS